MKVALHVLIRIRAWCQEGQLDPKGLRRIWWARDVGGAHVGSSDKLMFLQLIADEQETGVRGVGIAEQRNK
jgi:hypothetical protein